MQPTFTEIKYAAKKALKHRWAEAIAVSMVFLATALLDIMIQVMLMTILKVNTVWTPFTPTEAPVSNTIASICITAFSGIFSITVMFPLIFGVMRWFWNVTGGGDPNINDIFCYFSTAKLFFKSLKISLGLFLRLIIGAVVCFLPYALIDIFTSPDIYSAWNINMPSVMAGFRTLTSTFELIGFIAFTLFMATFAPFYAIMYIEPELSAHSTLKRATVISRHNRWRFVGFVISFMGWFALCLLALPLIFVVRFFMGSLAIYGREAYRHATRSNSTDGVSCW